MPCFIAQVEAHTGKVLFERIDDLTYRAPATVTDARLPILARSASGKETTMVGVVSAMLMLPSLSANGAFSFASSAMVLRLL